MSSWVNYMPDERSHVPNSTLGVAVFGAIISALIIIHSSLRHKKVYKTVRILTEICAYSTCCACILTVITLKYPSRLGNAVINNFLVTGMLNWFCQVSDNLVFYFGYKAATSSVSKWKTNFVYLYIATVMSISWLPTFTINSFYTDTTTVDYITHYYIPGQLVYTWGNVLYNSCFTIEFINILYKVHILECKQYSKPAREISIKCCIHFFTSSAVTVQLYYSQTPLQAVLIYIIVLTVSVHFLFNYRGGALHVALHRCLARARTSASSYASGALSPVAESVRLLSARVWRARTVPLGGRSHRIACAPTPLDDNGDCVAAIAHEITRER